MSHDRLRGACSAVRRVHGMWSVACEARGVVCVCVCECAWHGRSLSLSEGMVDGGLGEPWAVRRRALAPVSVRHHCRCLRCRLVRARMCVRVCVRALAHPSPCRANRVDRCGTAIAMPPPTNGPRASRSCTSSSLVGRKGTMLLQLPLLLLLLLLKMCPGSHGLPRMRRHGSDV